MPRLHLLSTPEGLKALQARHPTLSIQGPHGFISTELVFRDARAAHDLQGLLRNLYLASARAYMAAKANKGRLDPHLLTDLASALSRAQGWR